MKKHNMLLQVLAIAQREQQDRQFSLANAERQLLRSRETEKVLDDYRLEQLQLKEKKIGAINSAQQLLIMRNFTEKLNIALVQQRAKVAMDEASLAMARARLTAAMVHLRSIEKLQHLREQRLREQELKREQQQIDELASIKSHLLKTQKTVIDRVEKDSCDA